jgi:hypothetical protein
MPGGPTFLADGFSRTELSLNRFGQGRRSTMTEAHSRRYNVGLTYGVLGGTAWSSSGAGWRGFWDQRHSKEPLIHFDSSIKILYIFIIF